MDRKLLELFGRSPKKKQSPSKENADTSPLPASPQKVSNVFEAFGTPPKRPGSSAPEAPPVISLHPYSTSPRKYNSSETDRLQLRAPGLSSRASSRTSVMIPSNRASSYNMIPVEIKETHRMSKDIDPGTGMKLVNQYMIINELGRGVHGKVKLAVNTETNENVAIKIVRKQPKKKLPNRSGRRIPGPSEQLGDKVKKEIAIMKKCTHPNIVSLFEVIDDPSSEKIYLVLEYLKGGEVHWRNPMETAPAQDIDVVRRIFRDLICGVQYLHYQGIIHRDIKPANLIWSSDGRVKISDFGVSLFLPVKEKQAPSSSNMLSKNSLVTSQVIEENAEFKKSLSNDLLHTRKSTAEVEMTAHEGELELAKTVGSPAFFAPELCSFVNDEESSQLHKHRDPLEIGKAIDIWAIGVTLFCLVFGRLPFEADYEFELFHRISKDPTGFPVDISISPDLKNLLERLLTKDPTKRITLEEAKSHGWTTEDMTGVEKRVWFEESDPGKQSWMRVEVTDEEVQSAVKLVDFLRNSFRRISSSIMHFSPFATKKSSRATSLMEPNSLSRSHLPAAHSFGSELSLNVPDKPASRISTEEGQIRESKRDLAMSPESIEANEMDRIREWASAYNL